MATTYKVLGQSIPAANTASDLYTVPASTQTVVSSIVMCNQASSTGKFRVAIRPAGETLATKHYISYDTEIPGNDTITLTLGMSLGNTDVITVYSFATSSISYNLFGAEIT
jgi:glucose-6-phosphate dehydrogenase assembly protein OpcA